MKIFLGLALLVTVVVFVGLLFSLPVMLLWNLCLVPAVEILHEITWLQAWGIFILCGMLFKSADLKINDKG